MIRFDVYKDGKGEWRWRLIAANGRILADGGEGYSNRQDCLNAIQILKQQCVVATVNILPGA